MPPPSADVLDLVDREALARFIADVAPMESTIDVEVLSGGASNLTYLVRSGPLEYVVRRRPLGHVAAGAHDMRREFQVQDALGSTTLPIPRVYGYCEDESIVGAPFYVMSRVHGSVFHEPADVAAITAEQGAAISDAAVEELTHLHATDYRAVGLGELGRPDGFVARRIGRWLEQWRRSEHRELPLVEGLADRLAAAVPEHTDSTLIHGDYRLGNMLIDVAEPVHVAAILDWEMSTLGDPLTDLAHLLVYWEPSRGRVTHESQLIAQQPGFRSGAELADRYATASGRDLSHLDFYLAFEHWRAAIIKEAIFMRRRRGEHPGEASDTFADSVSRHLEEAADLLGAPPT